MNQFHHPRIRGRILAGAVVMAMGLLGGATAAHASLCVAGPGVSQTETTVTGSGGDDTIDCGGTSPAKTINGNGGNDTITGNNFDATINGGDGNDTITAGTGTDAITGGDGNDTLTGGAGADSLKGGLGIDTINGGFGNDNLEGPSTDGSEDKLFAGDDTDTCQGPAPDPDIHNSCENVSTPSVTGPGSAAANAAELCQASGGLYANLSRLAYECVFLNPFSNHRIPEARNVCTQRGGAFVVLPSVYSCVLPNGMQAVGSRA